jgi:predicted dehydrogenase
MTGSKLGFGIIGVNPAWGWAATAHIPALRALPNYEIRALSATSEESARAAGVRAASAQPRGAVSTATGRA